MDIRHITGVIAIVVPIVFNVAFFALGRAFDYPDILRLVIGRGRPTTMSALPEWRNW